MNQQFDSNIIEKIITDVAAIHPRGKHPLTGRVVKIIRQDGKYVEGGFVFKEEDLLCMQLFCDGAVLVRDMYHYLKNKDRDDAKSFIGLVEEVQKEEALTHKDAAFPSYKIVPDNYNRLDIMALDKGEPIDLSLLSEVEIIHEWNFIPGVRFIKKLCMRSDIRKAVCNKVSKSDFIRKFGESVETASMVKVTEAIVTATFSATALWYPLAACAAVYILNQAFRTYCSE